jgi:short-subunit dehydrogenase
MSQAKVSKKIAIITGASSGLGVEFARQVERAYFLDEIWLVARRAGPMKELADAFQKSKGVVLALDLTDRGDLLALQKRISDEAPEIEILVNNAGYGKIGPFADLGLDEQMQMIDLNVRTLTYLTHIVLPHMKAGSKIVQVASSIAYSPAPYFAVYAATKAYVASLSDALNFELRHRGIHVMSVCPGPVATEFFTVAQKNEYMRDKVGEAEPFNRFLTVSAHDVVEKALHDLGKRRRRSIFSLPIKAFVSAIPFVPRALAMRALSLRNKSDLSRKQSHLTENCQ